MPFRFLLLAPHSAAWHGVIVTRVNAVVVSLFAKLHVFDYSAVLRAVCMRLNQNNPDSHACDVNVIQFVHPKLLHW